MVLTRFDLKSRLTLLSGKSQALLARYPMVSALAGSRQGRMALLALAIVMIWFVGYVRLYQPGSEKLGRLKSRIHKVEEKIAEMKQQMPDITREQDMLEEKDRMVEALRSQLHEAEQRLPSRQELAPILEQITRSEEGAAVSILAIKPVKENEKEKKRKGEAAEPRFYPLERFEIEMLAGFWELVRYLARLEQVSPYFSFPGLQIFMEKGREGIPKVRLEVATLLLDQFARGIKRESVFEEDIPKFSYEGAERDPFRAGVESTAAATSSENYKVTGVIWQGGRKVAIINNEVVREGDTLGKNAKVITIGDTKIVIEEGARQYEIAIHE